MKWQKIKLLHGDCLEVMKDIPDKSIDMILCDLPYGTTACKWDVVIPFEPLWIQYKRIIKDRGCIALFGSEPFSSYLRMSNIKDYKYDWVWQKDNSKATNFTHAKNMPLKNYEIISIFSTSIIAHFKSINRMEYYPQGLIKYNKTVKGINKGGKNNSHFMDRPSHKKQYTREYTNYPTCILYYKSDWIKQLHPTQKPVPLLEYLIKTYTLEGETVLDNCMGSGSTGVACKNLNRDFIGIEKDDKYYELAKHRIEGHKPQGQLFES